MVGQMLQLEDRCGSVEECSTRDRAVTRYILIKGT